MKMMYIVNARIPTEKAHGLQIVKMCEAFGDAGVALTLVLPTRKNPILDKISIYDYYKVKNNFQITKLRTLDPRFLLKFPAGTYSALLFFFFGRRISGYLEKQTISKDTVLYTRDQYLLPVLLKFSQQVVWEAHDLPRNKTRYVSYWKKCSKIITITHGLKDELVTLGLNRENIFVAPDGVDLKIFGKVQQSPTELKAKFNLPQDKKIVLYTGHLYDWKGVHVLAEAASRIDSNAVVIFLGGTDADAAKFKSQYGTQANIIVLARVEHHRVPEYLQAADILVLPNSGKTKISSKYTSPLKLFEYMSAHKPIVATSLPSLEEILNSKNAILVEPDNPAELAAGINAVLNDSSLAKKVAEHAYLAVGQYSWTQRSRNIVGFVTS